MNIPEKIRIGSCDYAVEFTEQNLVAGGNECYATINYENHIIKINNQLGDKQTNEVSFLHEMFHGIVKERNLNIQDEELVVEELARSLHQIIRDNPELFTTATMAPQITIEFGDVRETADVDGIVAKLGATLKENIDQVKTF